jgi:phosphatidylinositol phospholipase C, delta
MMSPETAIVTNNTSPDSLRGRERDVADGILPPSLDIGESIMSPGSLLSRKTSSNSLGPSFISNPSTISESAPKSGSIIRRLSNRAQKFATRRRQSSAAPHSRDGSVGPGILRRRSDSNSTAPPEFGVYAADSDDDYYVEELDDRSTLVGYDGTPPKESPLGSPAPSISGVSLPSNATYRVSPQLLTGTSLRKVSKTNRNKRITLVLEPDLAMLSWDKNRPHKSLRIDDIKDIRTGTDIRQYQHDIVLTESEKLKWFTILYAVPDKSRSKMMHLIADTTEVFLAWVQTLLTLQTRRQGMMTSLLTLDDKAIRAFWQNEMSRQFGDRPHTEEEEEVDFATVERICWNLHMHASKNQLSIKFQVADSDKTQRLNFQKFQDFITLMKRRDDVSPIYSKFTKNPQAGMTFPEFVLFLQDCQGEDVSESKVLVWESIFLKFARKYKPKSGDKQDIEEETEKMTDVAFASFLASKYNVPLLKEQPDQAFDRPMNEYFISSSHNTYLLGRQVAGASSVEGYIAALVRGCRCVEVDCWDGSDGQPVVNHGRTLTTSISFRDVITTINKYAFYKSKFPLWISFEVHCNAAQQAIMAKIIKEIFGSRLVTEPLDPTSDRLPSPSQLMERILIKVKKPQPVVLPTPELGNRRRGNSLSSPYTKPVVLDNIPIPSQSLPQSPLLSPIQSSRRLVSKGRVNTITEGEVQEAMSSSTSDNDSSGEKPAGKRSSKKTIPALGDLGVYCAGIKFRKFDSPDAREYNHIFSFMESSFSNNSKSKESKKALDLHNMRYMMRVYPERTRITSNNFDPLAYWRRGVQMAALNWQTFDLGMQLNQAMFQGGSDASGYVLKPNALREIQHMRDGWTGKRERKEVNFSIDVISAQQLMRPNGMPANKAVNPYVEVEIFHANDKRDKRDEDTTVSTTPDTPLKVRTQPVSENGFNPIFDRKLRFKVTTKYPELIFIRWSVRLSHDGESFNDRPPVATFTAKLTSLQQGYRTLPLLDHNGDQYLFSTLFCRIKVDSITPVFLDYTDNQSDTGSNNRLRGLGRGVFSRSSPKSSLDKSSSFDSALS